MTRIIFPALLAILFSAGACTTSQNMTLKADGSGTASVKINVDPLFAEYFVEEGSKQGKVFDVNKLKKGLETRPGVKVTRIVAPTANSLEMDLSFANIEKVFSDGKSSLVKVTKKNGTTTVRFTLSRDNAKELGSLFADVSNPAFKELSPREQRKRTEKDYLEAIQFAVGDEAPAIMKKSVVNVTAAVGTLVSQVGGKDNGNGSVTWRVRLLSLLMMEKPIDFSITFKDAK